MNMRLCKLTEFTLQNITVKSVGWEEEERYEHFKEYLCETKGPKLYFSVEALLKRYLIFT